MVNSDNLEYEGTNRTVGALSIPDCLNVTENIVIGRQIGPNRCIGLHALSDCHEGCSSNGQGEIVFTSGLCQCIYSLPTVSDWIVFLRVFWSSRNTGVLANDHRLVGTTRRQRRQLHNTFCRRSTSVFAVLAWQDQISADSSRAITRLAPPGAPERQGCSPRSPRFAHSC